MKLPAEGSAGLKNEREPVVVLAEVATESELDVSPDPTQDHGRRVWPVAAGATFACAAAALSAPSAHLSHTLTNVVAGLAVLALLLAAALRRAPARVWAGEDAPPFLLMAGALVALIVGGVVHRSLAPVPNGSNLVAGVPSEVLPSWGDLIALLGYPLAIGALVSLVAIRVPGRAPDCLFPPLIAASAVGFLAWVVACDRLAARGLASAGPALVAIAFPALDLAIVFLALRLVLLATASRQSYWFMVLGWAALLVVHVGRVVSLTSGTAMSERTLACASVLAYGFLAVSALHPPGASILEPPVAPPRLGPWHIVLLPTTVLLGPALLALRLGGAAGSQVGVLLGSAALSLFVLADLLRLVQVRSTVEHTVHHDALTGLPNRTLFDDRVGMAIAHARRTRGMAAVMFLDLDRFKNVNDSLGHQAGNQLLQGVAKRLRQCVRAEDTVARLSGDEFSVLLPVVGSPAHAVAVAQKVLEAFSDPFHAGRRKLFVSPSIGIALYPTDGEDSETLLKNADTAMYRAKEQGRKTYRIYNRSMNAKAHERLELESTLHTAIERHELVLHYQPKVDLRSGRVTGMEALVRWRHPRLGLLAPAKFIPLAEESGLILPLGEWALEEACRQNKAWHDAGLDLVVAVNLSARQFEQARVEDLTAAVLRQTGLDPRFLELEVTESLALGDPEAIKATLRDLKDMGVSCSIDDFGTGYSGLSYLTQFPIDKLKIDRSFVRAIDEGGEDAAIVRAVVALAHSLNLQVIAEGVETAEQLEFLRKLGCDEMQGFLFSRPLPPDRFESALRPESSIRAAGQRAARADDHVEQKPEGEITDGANVPTLLLPRRQRGRSGLIVPRVAQ